MRIPVISKILDSRKSRSERLVSEAKYYQTKTAALKELGTTAAKAMNAMVQAASLPNTLNSELYGDTSPYSSQVWGESAANARRISRIAYWESPTAQAMVGRFVDLVYGPKLDLQSSPVWDIIPGAPATIEARQKLVNQIEARHGLWAKKKDVSYDKSKNHYKTGRFIFKDLLIDGEYFVILRYSASRKRNPLTTQIIKPERVQRSSSKVFIGNTEVNGIEYDAKGEEVAYHILNGTSGNSVRVPKIGQRSGRVNVIHNTIGEGRRGVGILAGIITELTKLADYQSLEIQAAVINALFAVWVETEIGGDTTDLINKNGIGGINTAKPTYEKVTDAEFEAKLNKTNFSKGGMIVQGMGEGQKLHSFDTKRPTANFEAFFNAVKRNLYSAKGMPLSVADYKFDASYSAIRGELLVFWNKVLTLRLDNSLEYEDVIYRMWLWGEIDRGVFNLQGWNDPDTQDAWVNARWIGPQRPDIDPMRSAKANELESTNAWKSDKQISAERGGGDFDENIQRKVTENKLKAEANKPLVELEKTTFSNSNNVTESTTKTED